MTRTVESLLEEIESRIEIYKQHNDSLSIPFTEVRTLIEIIRKQQKSLKEIESGGCTYGADIDSEHYVEDCDHCEASDVLKECDALVESEGEKNE